jgi:dipeptidyl aminopeptidase/acylaminoacyl peptidase
MSTHDPITLLRANGGGSATPREAFADGLLEILLAELDQPAPHPLPRRAGWRVLFIAAAFALLLSGIATAAYFLGRPNAARTHPKPGSLTLIVDPSNRAAKVVEVLPNGRQAIAWRCPGNVFCGDLESVDWAPDGRRVAFSLTEIGGKSAYIGLHIVDVRTGRDLHIPSVPLAHPMAAQPDSLFPTLLKQMVRRLGCLEPDQLAWSPNSRSLAYSCRTLRGRQVIATIRRDGTHRRLLRTGTRDAYWPSWSPDGNSIVFATGPKPTASSLYVISVNGSGRQLIASGGTAPDWSPEAKEIAYQADDGIRIISPRGVDVTPPGPDGKPRSIALSGNVAWSPDGSQLAVGTARGVEIIDAATGTHKLVTHQSGRNVFGGGRPAWYPGVAAPFASPAE